MDFCSTLCFLKCSWGFSAGPQKEGHNQEQGASGWGCVACEEAAIGDLGGIMHEWCATFLSWCAPRVIKIVDIKTNKRNGIAKRTRSCKQSLAQSLQLFKPLNQRKHILINFNYIITWLFFRNGSDQKRWHPGGDQKGSVWKVEALSTTSSGPSWKLSQTTNQTCAPQVKSFSSMYLFAHSHCMSLPSSSNTTTTWRGREALLSFPTANSIHLKMQ